MMRQMNQWRGWRDIRNPTPWPRDGQICWVWCYLDKEPRIAHYAGRETFYDGLVGSNITSVVEFWLPVEESPPTNPPGDDK